MQSSFTIELITRDDWYQVSQLMINVLCGLIWDMSQEKLIEGMDQEKEKWRIWIAQCKEYRC